MRNSVILQKRIIYFFTQTRKLFDWISFYKKPLLIMIGICTCMAGVLMIVYHYHGTLVLVSYTEVFLDYEDPRVLVPARLRALFWTLLKELHEGVMAGAKDLDDVERYIYKLKFTSSPHYYVRLKLQVMDMFLKEYKLPKKFIYEAIQQEIPVKNETSLYLFLGISAIVAGVVGVGVIIVKNI